MGIAQAYKMAIKSIMGNKARALLTMLGVIIGIGAVIATVAYAQGSTKNITDQISSMGTNMITISIQGRNNSNRNVTYDDLQKFAQDNVTQISGLAPSITNNSVTVKALNKSRSTSLIGTSDQYEIIRNVHVQSGRFLSTFDVDNRQKVVLVGTTVVNDIFNGQNPLNQQMKINGEVFNVVGVLQERASSQDQTDDDQIIIPVTVAQRLTKSASIRNFSVQAVNPESIDPVMTKLNDFLMKIFRDARAFRVFNQAQALSTLNSVTDSMMALLGGIATISLVVGGIGIMNIMLVSVTERTREIGIRKAIGAKKKNIMIQFLIEALMITGMGGIVGILLGVGIIKFVIGVFAKVPEVYSSQWMIMSFCISLLVGIVFGLFPAYKAAKLNPIEALRFE